jgi:hypothetical protein
MAGNSDANIAANEAVQMNDAEMDSVSAAGIGLGKANAPGQQMKLLRQQSLLKVCAHGNSCNAPGLLNRGASTFAPGRVK